MKDAATMQLYVSTEGNDGWTGRLDAPNKDKTDGPFATLGKAKSELRGLKQAGKLTGPVTVLLRGGRYHLSGPIVFGPKDSWPVTYAAYPGEKPILDGGVRIEGWKVKKRGKATMWVVDLPEVAAGEWYFKQLMM